MIYCVEDDAAIRDLVIYTLTASGMEAAGFPDAASFRQAMQESQPDLVLLDIMLPGEDGLSVLKKLRADPSTAALPVILATARGTEYDKVIGLDLGADDYLAKPFGMMEMVSRIRAVLRRTGPQAEPALLTVGDIIVHLREHTVTVQGERISLTLKEYDLLCLLLQQPGRVFTREQLLQTVWDAGFIGETRTVDVHIGTLRTKLGVCGSYIETVRGVGYRLEKPV